MILRFKNPRCRFELTNTHTSTKCLHTEVRRHSSSVKSSQSSLVTGGLPITAHQRNLLNKLNDMAWLFSENSTIVIDDSENCNRCWILNISLCLIDIRRKRDSSCWYWPDMCRQPECKSSLASYLLCLQVIPFLCNDSVWFGSWKRQRETKSQHNPHAGWSPSAKWKRFQNVRRCYHSTLTEVVWILEHESIFSDQQKSERETWNKREHTYLLQVLYVVFCSRKDKGLLWWFDQVLKNVQQHSWKK